MKATLTKLILTVLSVLTFSPFAANACTGNVHLLLGNDTGGYIEDISICDVYGNCLISGETLTGGEGKYRDITVIAGHHYIMTAHDSQYNIDYHLDFYPSQQDGLVDFYDYAVYDEWGGDICNCSGTLRLLLGNDTGGNIQDITVWNNGTPVFSGASLTGGEGKWTNITVTAGHHYVMTARDPDYNIDYYLDFYPSLQDGLVDFYDYAVYDEWGDDICASTTTISTYNWPAAGGTTSGGGTVNKGSTVTVNANPNSCYDFVNWTESSVVVSTSPGYTFTANATRNLVAHFAVKTYTITTSSSPSNGGTTSGGGTKNCGSSVTVAANPNSCYHFVNWTENGNSVSTLDHYTFTASANRTLVANFALISYTISTDIYPLTGAYSPDWGTATGGGIRYCGSSVTVTATPAPGFTFVCWTEGDHPIPPWSDFLHNNEEVPGFGYGTFVSADAKYTFTPDQDRTLFAHFANTCTGNVELLVADGALSSFEISGPNGVFQWSGTIPPLGVSVTVPVIPGQRYIFIGDGSYSSYAEFYPLKDDAYLDLTGGSPFLPYYEHEDDICHY